MPEQIAFTTFVLVVAGLFFLMALVLDMFLRRSFSRAFRHLETVTELNGQIEDLRNKIGYCEEHGCLHDLIDSHCPYCSEEYDAQRRET